MSTRSVESDTQRRGEALRAAARTAAGQGESEQRRKAARAVGADRIACVVLPFLVQAAKAVRSQGGRLDYGVRKFDIVTGEKFSVYFSVVPNSASGSAKTFYIIDLSSQSPLLIVTDTLDVGSGVRRREISDLKVSSHNDITPEILETLLRRASDEAGLVRPDRQAGPKPAGPIASPLPPR